MIFSNLRPLQEKLYFTTGDVASLLKIKPESAQVLCSRYAQRGVFVRVKKNFYVLETNWNRYGNEDFFRLANFLQVPSYISCISALAYHGVTTQVPRRWYESISLKRTIRYEVHGAAFHYFKFKEPYYFGFVKIRDTFIAEKEKAFLDACHLSVFGEYAADWNALNMESLDRLTLEKMMAAFPDKTRRYVRDVCRI
jgi:predicted transcriptional regulator of viral defense system